MFLIKWFFFQCFGKFSSCRNGRVKSFSSRGKEEKQSWGEKETEEGGKRTKIIFSFFVKTEKKKSVADFFPVGECFFHETLCVRNSTGQVRRYQCRQLRQVSSGSTVPAFWSFRSPSPHAMEFVAGEVVVANHHFMVNMLRR